MIKNVILVALGGGLGSLLRYGCQKWVYHLYPSSFPWGTWLVNITGCFAIGLFFAIAIKSNLITPSWSLFLTTGLCGGFTTFSSFAFENMNLLKNGDITSALLYTLGSVVLGIVAVFAGVWVIKLF